MTDPNLSSYELLQSTIEDRRPVHDNRQIKFAFYGRVSSTEDQGLQDREVSRSWQIRRAENLVGAENIIAEFFDDVSRSKPFHKREEGAKLLQIISTTRPPWNGLVIGEAKRVFAGSQLEDVSWQLARAGIELWIPELGGRYDENNMTHRILLSMEGLMGKAESDTVRGRVRDAMTSIAVSPSDRRWLGGNAPYGYQLVRLEQHERRTTSSKGYLQTLALNPETAPIARRIFDEFLNGKSYREIAALLERDHIPSPTGRSEWNTATISTILSNMTYVGHRIYGKQRKYQAPASDDPRDGTETRRTRNGEPPVISPIPVFPPIISAEEFKRVETLRKAKKTLHAPRKKESQRRGTSEPLRGRIFYEGKKLTPEKTRHGKVRYRSNARDGFTKRVYVYDVDVREVVHEWLAVNLSRRNLPLLIKQLKQTAPRVATQVKKLEAERTRLRAAASNLLTLVETGDPAAVERYRLRIAEAAEVEDRIAALKAENLDVDGVVRLMRTLAAETRKEVLDRASNERLNRLYDSLGLRVDYVPEEGGIRLSLAPLFSATANMLQAAETPSSPEIMETTGDDGVGAKGGAPGGAFTLAPTRRVPVVFSVLLELPKAA